ncbi:MAG TPA: hypothetical protein VEG28_05080 [Dehalococcoidia bacterium]|nr:hypothetical protein [Dehalococcoidia bacterium]
MAGIPLKRKWQIPLAPTEIFRRRGWSARKSSKNQLIEQYQEMNDLDKVTQKLVSEISGKKLPCLSLGLQVTIIKVSVRKVLVA